MNKTLLFAFVGMFCLQSCLKSKENQKTDKESLDKEEVLPDLPQELASQFKLIWNDEFEGDSVDEKKWNFRREGDTRQFAVVSRNTVAIEDGKAAIAVTEDDEGNYWVGQLGTEGLFETTYGYFETRAKMNREEGPHVAFWLQSPTMTKTDDNPKKNGSEVDIFEYHRLTKDTVHHNIHWNGYGPEHKQIGEQVHIPTIAEGYHTFGLLWTPTKYVFYVDGKKTWETTEAVSQRDQYMILSTELTGFGGKPQTGKYPDKVFFDYVRVFKQK